MHVDVDVDVDVVHQDRRTGRATRIMLRRGTTMKMKSDAGGLWQRAAAAVAARASAEVRAGNGGVSWVCPMHLSPTMLGLVVGVESRFWTAPPLMPPDLPIGRTHVDVQL